MIAIIENVRNNKKIKKILKIFMEILCSFYLFFIPSFSGRYPLNYIGYLLFVLLLFITFVYGYLYEKIRIDYRIFPLFIFTIIAFISTCLYSKMFREWLTLFLLLLSTFVFLLIFDYEENKEKIILFCMASFFLFSIYYLFVYRVEIFNFSSMFSARLGGYFDNENQVGTYFAILLFFSAYFSFYRKGYIQILSIFIFFLSMFLGFTTGSRTFLLSSVLCVIIISFFRFKKRPLLYALILFSIIISFFILINLPFAESIKNRFDILLRTLFSSNEYDASTVTRMLWQEYGFYLGLKNFFIGLGTRGFAVFSGVGTYTHGDYSDIFCNFGMLGFCAYYSIWILCFKGQVSIRNPIKFLALAILIVMLFKGFLGVSYMDKINSFIIAFVLSVCTSEFNKNYYAVRI